MAFLQFDLNERRRPNALLAQVQVFNFPGLQYQAHIMAAQTRNLLVGVWVAVALVCKVAYQPYRPQRNVEEGANNKVSDFKRKVGENVTLQIGDPDKEST